MEKSYHSLPHTRPVFQLGTISFVVSSLLHLFYFWLLFFRCLVNRWQFYGLWQKRIWFSSRIVVWLAEFESSQFFLWNSRKKDNFFSLIKRWLIKSSLHEILLSRLFDIPITLSKPPIFTRYELIGFRWIIFLLRSYS